MCRSAAIMVLAAATLFPVSVQAQIRNGHAGFGGRGGFRHTSGTIWRAPGPFAGFPSLGFGLSSRPMFALSPPYDYYRPFPAPMPVYSFTIPAAVPAYSPAREEEPEVRQTAGQSELELAYQVGRLTQEVEQLRQEQALRASPQAQQIQPPQPATPSIPKVVIFQDGHRLEIRNYAIVGQILWVLDGQGCPKFSLSDLNLGATQKENRDRGVSLSLP
jgi:hypothetical protein